MFLLELSFACAWCSAGDEFFETLGGEFALGAETCFLGFAGVVLGFEAEVVGLRALVLEVCGLRGGRARLGVVVA